VGRLVLKTTWCNDRGVAKFLTTTEELATTLEEVPTKQWTQIYTDLFVLGINYVDTKFGLVGHAGLSRFANFKFVRIGR
jgi:hypothetical protein